MKILPSQKNALFEAIEGNGLSPNLLSIKEEFTKEGRTTKIECKNTEFYFLLHGYNGDGDTRVTFCPAEDRYALRTLVYGWNGVLFAFGKWVRLVEREISVIDKWQRLEEEVKQVNITYSNAADRFSAFEYEELKGKMLLLKGRLKELGLQNEQVKAIESKLDHLTELAVQMNKFDWKGLFIGTIVSLILENSLTAENTRSLWAIIKNVFHSIFLQ